MVRHQIQHSYDAFGRVSSSKEKGQNATTAHYDSLDRTVKVARSDGSGTQTQFEISGVPSEVKSFKAGGALKLTTASTINSLGRVVAQTVTPTAGRVAYSLGFQYDPFEGTLAVTHSDISLNSGELGLVTSSRAKRAGTLKIRVLLFCSRLQALGVKHNTSSKFSPTRP